MAISVVHVHSRSKNESWLTSENSERRWKTGEKVVSAAAINHSDSVLRAQRDDGRYTSPAGTRDMRVTPRNTSPSRDVSWLNASSASCTHISGRFVWFGSYESVNSPSTMRILMWAGAYCAEEDQATNSVNPFPGVVHWQRVM